MGTEKCPFCGQEIDAEATRCFFCGASLDEESVERRLEELHYQQDVRRTRKVRSPVALELLLVGILLGIILLYGTPGGKHSSSLERPSRSSMIRLNAKVTFRGSQFVIANNDSFDWENVKLEAIVARSGEPFCLTIAEPIPAGGTYTAKAAEFCRKDGIRFDPPSMKLDQFWIRCDTPERENGSYLAGWE